MAGSNRSDSAEPSSRHAPSRGKRKAMSPDTDDDENEAQRPVKKTKTGPVKGAKAAARAAKARDPTPEGVTRLLFVPERQRWYDRQSRSEIEAYLNRTYAGKMPDLTQLYKDLGCQGGAVKGRNKKSAIDNILEVVLQFRQRVFGSIAARLPNASDDYGDSALFCPPRSDPESALGEVNSQKQSTGKGVARPKPKPLVPRSPMKKLNEEHRQTPAGDAHNHSTGANEEWFDLDDLPDSNIADDNIDKQGTPAGTPADSGDREPNRTTSRGSDVKGKGNQNAPSTPNPSTPGPSTPKQGRKKKPDKGLGELESASGRDGQDDEDDKPSSSDDPPPSDVQASAEVDGGPPKTRWPNRYYGHNWGLPIWAVPIHPHQEHFKSFFFEENNVRRFFYPADCSCDDDETIKELEKPERKDNSAKIDKIVHILQDYGHNGWQCGRNEGLCAAMEQRGLDWTTDTNKTFKWLSRRRELPLRSDKGDGDATEDNRAYAMTHALLNYELEAAVRRFGGDMLLQMQQRIFQLRQQLHCADGGLVNNRWPRFYDPWVGYDYALVPRDDTRPRYTGGPPFSIPRPDFSNPPSDDEDEDIFNLRQVHPREDYLNQEEFDREYPGLDAVEMEDKKPMGKYCPHCAGALDPNASDLYAETPDDSDPSEPGSDDMDPDVDSHESLPPGDDRNPSDHDDDSRSTPPPRYPPDLADDDNAQPPDENVDEQDEAGDTSAVKPSRVVYSGKQPVGVVDTAGDPDLDPNNPNSSEFRMKNQAAFEKWWAEQAPLQEQQRAREAEQHAQEREQRRKRKREQLEDAKEHRERQREWAMMRGETPEKASDAWSSSSDDEDEGQIKVIPPPPKRPKLTRQRTPPKSIEELNQRVYDGTLSRKKG